MDSLILVVCLVGIVCAMLTIFLNLNLVFRIVLTKSKRIEEMILFYYRFVLDIFFGFCLLLYILYVLLSLESPDFMSNYRPLIVFLALPWSNLAACRSIIAVSIALDRVLATYFPMKYRSKRKRFPNFMVLLVGLLFGFSENLVLFTLCEYDMEIPSSCQVFGCAMNKCFYNFWTLHKAIIFSAILGLSILLSVKLFLWNKFKSSAKSARLSRANRLALLDTVTVLFFDFLPSFCGNLWPTAKMFSFDYVGPYNAVGKVIGCAIESAVVTTVLLPRHSSIGAERSLSQRKTGVKKTSSMVSFARPDSAQTNRTA